jgi:hypothetical protein
MPLHHGFIFFRASRVAFIYHNLGRAPLKVAVVIKHQDAFRIGAKQVGPSAALLVGERDERPGSDEFIGRLGTASSACRITPNFSVDAIMKGK